MADRKPIVEFIIKNQSSLIQMDLLKDLFMIPDRTAASSREGDVFKISCLSNLYKGKLFVFDNLFFSVDSFERVDLRDSEERTYEVKGTNTGIVYDPDEVIPICIPQDTFILNSKEIPNFTSDKSVETTMGIFIANYIFFVYPFDDVIPYLNEEITTGKMEKQISMALMEDRIDVQMVKDKYVNALSLIGGSPDLLAPNISEKTITIPKEIKELRERLVAENREALEAGDATVMSMIENTLINRYKEYLKGDSSMHFLLKSKYFSVTLKKLFLTHGMVEVFGSPGKFEFIDNPLGQGWKIKDLPTIFNEVRQGSYARAIETADGGVVAKLILRVLQDTRIDIDDCGTTRGEHIHATKDQLKDFEWNYVIEPDGSNSLITQQSMDSFLGKDIVVRTPGYCEASPGFCARCFGRIFEVVGQKAFAPVANSVGTVFLTASLKKMHGSTVATTKISDINRYLVK